MTPSHVVDSLKSCSPLVLSGVNAPDVRNISLSYHAEFFVGTAGGAGGEAVEFQPIVHPLA